MTSRSPQHRTIVWTMVALLLPLLAGCSEDDDVLFPGMSAELNAQLTDVRNATASLQTVQDAGAAGYGVLVTHPGTGDRCLRHTQLGGMGFHYLNPDHLDGSVAVEEPEVLIYEPRSDGSLELVGVEYVIPFDIHGQDQPAPILFGREFRQNLTFGLWALHAWVWRENPNGVFADWNPDVSCTHDGAVGGGNG